MDKTKVFLFFITLAAGLLAATPSRAQEVSGPPVPPARTGAAYMGYRVEKGDTVYYDSINPVWVFPRGRRGKSDLKSYYRLVYNFNKVYPYALLAKDLTMQVDDHIAQNSLRRRKKEKYISQIGKSSYKIIKDYKSGITAGFWQGVAKIFGNDLKSSYDPKGDDKMTEYLVEKWRMGEFDALYYSIFWEMPKHPEIRSKTIKFED